MLFRDRREAGRKLAHRLRIYKDQNPIILAVPRGGVILGAEVAQELQAPLDLVIPRKIPAPFNEELAIGALAPDDTLILDEHLIHLLGLPHEYIEKARQAARQEIQRRLREYRGERPLPELKGKTAIVVDDGIATGLTVRAAILSLKKAARRVILAVPVAPADVRERITEADEIFSLITPEEFYAVGQFYQDFAQVSDEEVKEILQRTKPATV
ncbi:MAG: phosphoribosyltransferase [Firmicutes bacterium]|nr:phosphoribosyltransferase [Bacillota bacterium]MCL5040532.1 phosphoribosyltransferase [Bacillota bacterium]